MLCMLLLRNAQLSKLYTDCMSESWNSPPLLCCCGSWDWVSTRRLCPMIQPLRGLYLSCTQKRAHYPGQISSCTCLPPSLTKYRLLYLRSFLFLCVLLVCPSSTPFPSVLPPSLPLAISLRPSLPPGAGLPLPLNDPPSLAHSTGQHSLKDAFHSWEKDDLCFQFDACAVVCGPKCAFNNVCKM